MSELTLAEVLTWDPSELHTAAAKLKTASTAVDQQVKGVSRAVEAAAERWQGLAARAATDRAATEARTGRQLADALDHAHTALENGAHSIGTARTKLLGVIQDAESKGLSVSTAGVVSEAACTTNGSAPKPAAVAADITRALGAVADADSDTANALAAISFPQTLESEVDAYLKRLSASKNWMTSLGATGAGGASLALLLKKSFSLFGNSKAYLKFLQSETAPITDYATFLKNIEASDTAMSTFVKGSANGGFMRFLVGAKGAKVLGRIGLPLTVISGAVDTVTGGGYTGARGWATRGFGLAGAIGGGTLLAVDAGLVTIGPVGWAVAGGATLAYGAWSLGNFAWDHRQQIGRFFSSTYHTTAHALSNAYHWTGNAASTAYHWTGNAASTGYHDVTGAADWADKKLSGAGGDIVHTGGSVVHTLSFGVL